MIVTATLGPNFYCGLAMHSHHPRASKYIWPAWRKMKSIMERCVLYKECFHSNISVCMSFIYSYPDCPSCPADTIQMDWTAGAIWVAIKKYCVRLPYYMCRPLHLVWGSVNWEPEPQDADTFLHPPVSTCVVKDFVGDASCRVYNLDQ